MEEVSIMSESLNNSLKAAVRNFFWLKMIRNKFLSKKAVQNYNLPLL